jgi:hypothetical protein
LFDNFLKDGISSTRSNQEKTIGLQHKTGLAPTMSPSERSPGSDVTFPNRRYTSLEPGSTITSFFSSSSCSLVVVLADLFYLSRSRHRASQQSSLTTREPCNPPSLFTDYLGNRIALNSYMAGWLQAWLGRSQSFWRMIALEQRSPSLNNLMSHHLFACKCPINFGCFARRNKLALGTRSLDQETRERICRTF